MSNKLIQVIEDNKLEEATSKSLEESFLPFFQQAKKWKEKAENLVVTSVDQKREMKMAREARLALREIRINADKTRKALKEDSLRYGRAVQGVYNVIEYLISPIEKHLHDQEKFAEIKEAERKADLKAYRESEISPFSDFVPLGINLSEMPIEDYEKLLNGARLQFKAHIEAEKKAEAERLAKEKTEREEQERIRKENEQLRKEHEAQEAILQAERKAKAALEAEINAEREAKERAEKARIESERKAAAAPDKEKLFSFADQIDELLNPEFSTEQAKRISLEANEMLDKVTAFIRSESGKL